MAKPKMRITLVMLMAVVILDVTTRRVTQAAPLGHHAATRRIYGDFSTQQDLGEQVSSLMDWSVDPCNDFYNYACGEWLKNTTLKGDQVSVDYSFTTIGDYNNAVLKEIVEDPTQGRLYTFNQACMNTTRIDAAGAQPLKPLMERLNSVQAGDLDSFMSAVGFLHTQGVPTFFSFSSGVDSGNPAYQIMQFFQGGYALPSPSMYLQSDPSSKMLLRKYLVHIEKMMVLAGQSPLEAAQTALAAFTFEHALAKFSTPADQLNNPFATYNMLNISGLEEIAPHLSWSVFLNAIGVPEQTQAANVGTPEFFTLVDAWLARPGVGSLLRPYLQWQLVHYSAPLLSHDFVAERFEFFGKVLTGQERNVPRDQQCISFADQTLGELLGAAYVSVAFPPEAESSVEEMVQALEDAMRRDIESTSWMDPTTKSRALQKLSMLYNMVGYPQKPDNYTTVQVSESDFFGNVLSGSQYAFNNMIASLQQPTDRTKWEMTADTVNAYYDPTLNEIVLPAGILQPPFFSMSYPLSMVFGGIGMVIGHEITHGFDNQGSDYDGTGRLVDWWLPQTRANFQERVDCVIKQYDQFEILPGLYVNGRLTQGENVADMGGVKNSFYAYLNVSGATTTTKTLPVCKPATSDPTFCLTDRQLYFVAFAQGWCAKETTNQERILQATDPHSPPQFRVQGPLQNFPTFAQTFECPVGSTYNPTSRCEVW